MPKLMNPSNGTTEIRVSPGKGRGVFALKPIAKGAIIEVAPTITVPAEDFPFIKMTMLMNYAFADDIDDDLNIIGLGHASMYNDSANPNAEWATGKGVLIIRALKAIKAGEEITFDYGWDDEEYEAEGMRR